jgi:hypothetical protein
MPQIDVHARSHAPPDRVWSLLADTRSWADWAPLDEITVEDGHDVGESAGCGPDRSRRLNA